MKSKMEVGFINGMRAARNNDLQKNVEKYEKYILRKIDFVIYLGEKDNLNGINPNEDKFNEWDMLKFNISQQYNRWYIEKIEKSKIFNGEKEPFSLAKKIDSYDYYLQKISLKLNILAEDWRIALLDDQYDETGCLEYSLGLISILVDEPFSKKHFVKMLGMKIESKKRLVVFAHLIDVRIFLIKNVDFCETV